MARPRHKTKNMYSKRSLKRSNFSRNRIHQIKKPQKSPYDLHVDHLFEENKKKLVALGKPYDYTKRTDGERFISEALNKMGIRYVPEYVIKKLKGDTKEYRLADFYLPRENVYIEHLGNWNSKVDHKKRYKQKMAVYARNNLKCIYVFPGQLNNISWILKQQLDKIKKGEPTYTPKPVKPIPAPVTVEIIKQDTTNVVKIPEEQEKEKSIEERKSLFNKIYKTLSGIATRSLLVVGIGSIILSITLFFLGKKDAALNTVFISGWSLLTCVLTFVFEKVYFSVIDPSLDFLIDLVLDIKWALKGIY